MTYEEQLQIVEAMDREMRRALAARRRDARVGRWMVLFLAVGTIVEYAIAVAVDWNFPLMVAINVVEAAAIMAYFMHLPSAWRGGHDKEEA